MYSKFFNVSQKLYSLITQKLTQRGEDEAMIEIPQLPQVTNLTVEYCSENNHYMGAVVSRLLARCINLKYLNLDNQIHLQVSFSLTFHYFRINIFSFVKMVNSSISFKVTNFYIFFD